MATTVTSTKSVTTSGLGGRRRKTGGPNGNGSGGNGHFRSPGFSASRYRIGMWLGMAGILMMFTALSSAYIVRSGGATDWRSIAMPRVLLLSTALIVLSSLTLEIGKRKRKQKADGAYSTLLVVTAALGIGFLVSQFLAWRQLVRQGVYVASNPHSSFFYLLTATHGVHLFGGLMALGYLILRARTKPAGEVAVIKKEAAADAVTLYWHFMDVLWIYLFVLLFFWK
jgi:cytochrome c oxidase subunit 3